MRPLAHSLTSQKVQRVPKLVYRRKKHARGRAVKEGNTLVLWDLEREFLTYTRDRPRFSIIVFLQLLHSATEPQLSILKMYTTLYLFYNPK